jgi:hypothetical protein
MQQYQISFSGGLFTIKGDTMNIAFSIWWGGGDTNQKCFNFSVACINFMLNTAQKNNDEFSEPNNELLV